jgi:cellulose synthase/poly-beta-1,6-N-acetylglucosamine synthase-like glycosyltransferase
VYWRRIPVKPVRTIYHSRQHHGLRVIDKERGGTADAFNAGINASRYPLIIALDPRWALRNDALRELVEPIVDDPATVAVASTGAHRARAGGPGPRCRAAGSLLARLQVVEHLREPLFGRLGWARMNAALAVSNCAILCRKDAVVDAAGFRTDMLEEQMELVARMHRHARANGERYTIDVIPTRLLDPRGQSLGELRAQRMRWQVALAQTLAGNRDILWQPPAGPLRWLAYPFFGFFERWGPAVEVSATSCWERCSRWAAAGARVRGLPRARVRARLPRVDERAAARGDVVPPLSALGQAARLAIAAVVENLGYRQLVACWRLDGLLRWWQAK